jgi:hypothetical protein
MKTLQLFSFGPPADVVELAEVDPAAPGPGQLAVAIEAAPINPSDLNLIRGIYGVRPDLPAALGGEGVGRVIAVGDGVDPSRIGTRVLVIPTLEQATWRERTVLDERNAVPIDLNGDPLQLAMLGINPITAYCLLHGYVKLAPGAWVAQTGASSATAGYVLAMVQAVAARAEVPSDEVREGPEGRPRGRLRGRSREQEQLGRLLSGIQSGRSGVLVVRGEAGVGKTALLERLVEQASGCIVARATGVQADMELAFAGLQQLFGSMLGSLERLPDPQREAVEVAFGLRSGPAPDRFEVGLAMLGLLAEVAEQAPLVVSSTTLSGSIRPRP